MTSIPDVFRQLCEQNKPADRVEYAHRHEYYDAVAQLVRIELFKGGMHDLGQPYAGISSVFSYEHYVDGDAGMFEEQRCKWFVLPANPDVLVQMGHVQIGDRQYPLESVEAKTYLSNPYRALVYAGVAEVVGK